MNRLKVLILITQLWGASLVYAQEDNNFRTSLWNTPRLEFSFLNLFAASFASNLNFGVSDQFTIGPSLGFHPMYLFTAGGSVLAYDVGVDSNIFVIGDRYSSSLFVNPYTYYSGFVGYHVEKSIVHLGVNFGYRWIF